MTTYKGNTYKFSKMETSSSVTKISSKKSFSSLRALLCCQANKEDLVSMEHDSKPLQSSPEREISAMSKFLCSELCLHGNDRFCVACYFANASGVSKLNCCKDSNDFSSFEKSMYDNMLNGNIEHQHQLQKGHQGFVDNDLYCEICQVPEDNNNYRTPIYSNRTNTKSTNTYSTGYINSAAENDDEDDVFSVCSSCYLSNCEQCFQGAYNNNDYHQDNHYNDIDKTECSFYANQNFNSEALSKLLQTLDGSTFAPPFCSSDICDHSFTSCCQGEECASTDTGSTEKSRNDKDSGVGRTDESTKNDESSEQDVECTSPGHNIDPDHHCSNDSFTSNETQENDPLTTEQLLRECNNFREALETRCNPGDTGSGSPLLRIDSQSSIEREIDALNKEMAQIQIECQQIYEAHKKDPQKVKVKTESVSSNGDTFNKSGSPSRSVPRMGTRLEYIRQLNALQQDGAVDPVWVRHEKCMNMGTLIHRHNLLHPANIILPLDSGSANITPQNPSHNNIPFPNGHLSNGVKDDCSTTSAYFTGDSCRSTPLTLELTHIQNHKGQKQPLLSLSVASNQKSSDDAKSSVIVNGHHHQHGGDNDNKDLVNASESVSRTSQTPEPPAVDNLQDLYSQYAEVMYTNQANLQHTMMVQQRLFQQKLLQQQTEIAGTRSHESSPRHHPNADIASNASPKHHQNVVPAPFNSSPKHMTLLASPDVNGSLGAKGGGDNESSGPNNPGVQMEWVVKRRADGTRYITRRPMRSKFLKERARKICEERSGMTTDDDAMSELKCGRYWTKEDRKRHLEKAKEYKRRKQEMLRRKMETLKEIEEKKEPNILELSHRKMMKHKSKKAFDDFTTVQEMLVHGSRGKKPGVETSPSKTTSASPLLSVTTV